jgi:hypothetical protein
MRFLLVAMLVGCVVPETGGGSSPPPPTSATPPTGSNPTATLPTTPGDQTDVFSVDAAPGMDVLWVLDNAGPVDAELAAIVNNFPIFLDYFLGSGIDYHVGVISTDMSDPQQSGKLADMGGALWIDETTADPVGAFAAGVAGIGTAGGLEQGIFAAYAALELETQHNGGFFRADVPLQIITVSDSADASPNSPITVAEFSAYLQGLESSRGGVGYHAVVNPAPPNSCAALVGDGSRYLEVNAAVGGFTTSVCGTDWPDTLEALGLESASLQRSFALSAVPVVGTIEVSVLGVDGYRLAFAEYDPIGDTGDWTYDPVDNTVTFLAYVPASGSQVEISYEL